MERGEKSENVGIDFDERERVLRESFEREGGGGEFFSFGYFPSCFFYIEAWLFFSNSCVLLLLCYLLARGTKVGGEGGGDEGVVCWGGLQKFGKVSRCCRLAESKLFLSSLSADAVAPLNALSLSLFLARARLLIGVVSKQGECCWAAKIHSNEVGDESGKKAFLRSQPSCIYLLASSLDAVFAAFPAHRFSFISMGIGRLAAALSPEEDWMFRFRGREREREGRETRAGEREHHARASFFSFC